MFEDFCCVLQRQTDNDSLGGSQMLLSVKTGHPFKIELKTNLVCGLFFLKRFSV